MSAISLSVCQSAFPWTHNTKELNERSGERFANDTSMPVENKINTHKTHSYTLTHVRWNFCQSSAVSHTHTLTHTLLQTVCAVASTCGDHSTRLVYCNAFSLQCVRPELLQWCFFVCGNGTDTLASVGVLCLGWNTNRVKTLQKGETSSLGPMSSDAKKTTDRRKLTPDKNKSSE